MTTLVTLVGGLVCRVLMCVTIVGMHVMDLTASLNVPTPSTEMRTAFVKNATQTVLPALGVRGHGTVLVMALADHVL